MKVCPGCSRSTKTSERIEPDPKKKGRHWLITFCGKCGFNYDIEEYVGQVLSPTEEMERFQWPDIKRNWPKS